MCVTKSLCTLETNIILKFILNETKMNILMIKGIIHRGDRHHEPLDTLTTKKQRYIKQKPEEI